LKEKILGPDHPDTAMTLNNLAVLFQSRGDLEQASSLFRRALDILETTLDPDHPKVAACRKNFEELQRGTSKRDALEGPSRNE